MGNSPAGAVVGSTGNLTDEASSQPEGQQRTAEIKVINGLGLQLSLHSEVYGKGGCVVQFPATIGDSTSLHIGGSSLEGHVVYMCHVAHGQSIPKQMVIHAKQGNHGKAGEAPPKIAVKGVDLRHAQSRQFLALATRQEVSFFGYLTLSFGAAYGVFADPETAVQEAEHAIVQGTGERGVCSWHSEPGTGGSEPDARISLEVRKTDAVVLAQRSPLLDALERQSGIAAAKASSAVAKAVSALAAGPKPPPVPGSSPGPAQCPGGAGGSAAQAIASGPGPPRHPQEEQPAGLRADGAAPVARPTAEASMPIQAETEVQRCDQASVEGARALEEELAEATACATRAREAAAQVQGEAAEALARMRSEEEECQQASKARLVELQEQLALQAQSAGSRASCSAACIFKLKEELESRESAALEAHQSMQASSTRLTEMHEQLALQSKLTASEASRSTICIAELEGKLECKEASTQAAHQSAEASSARLTELQEQLALQSKLAASEADSSTLCIAQLERELELKELLSVAAQQSAEASAGRLTELQDQLTFQKQLACSEESRSNARAVALQAELARCEGDALAGHRSAQVADCRVAHLQEQMATESELAASEASRSAMRIAALEVELEQRDRMAKEALAGRLAELQEQLALQNQLECSEAAHSSARVVALEADLDRCEGAALASHQSVEISDAKVAHLQDQMAIESQLAASEASRLVLRVKALEAELEQRDRAAEEALHMAQASESRAQVLKVQLRSAESATPSRRPTASAPESNAAAEASTPMAAAPKAVHEAPSLGTAGGYHEQALAPLNRRMKSSGALALRAKAAANEAAERRRAEAQRYRQEELEAANVREEEARVAAMAREADALLRQEQDQEFQQSLLMDQLKDLMAREAALRAEIGSLEAEIEECSSLCSHAMQRIERFGENPRLAEERQRASDRLDKAKSRLDEAKGELIHAGDQIMQKNELLAAMLA